jgi:nitroreductase
MLEKERRAKRMAHNWGAAWCAAQNMMLQAEAEGLSSGVVSMGSEKVRGQLVSFLGFDPTVWTVAHVLNLGHGVGSPSPIQRKTKKLVEIRG